MPEWLTVSIFWLTLLFMLVGLIGLLVPFFPGVELIWIASLVYGLVSGFNTLGAWMFGLSTVLMLVAMVIDNIIIAARSHQEGAAWTSILVGMVAGLVGTVLIPPVGGLVFAPLAVYLLEYARLRDWEQAWAALRGWAIGWLTALVVRLFLAAAMIGLWFVWAWNS